MFKISKKLLSITLALMLISTMFGGMAFASTALTAIETSNPTVYNPSTYGTIEGGVVTSLGNGADNIGLRPFVNVSYSFENYLVFTMDMTIVNREETNDIASNVYARVYLAGNAENTVNNNNGDAVFLNLPASALGKNGDTNKLTVIVTPDKKGYVYYAGTMVSRDNMTVNATLGALGNIATIRYMEFQPVASGKYNQIKCENATVSLYDAATYTLDDILYQYEGEVSATVSSVIRSAAYGSSPAENTFQSLTTAGTSWGLWVNNFLPQTVTAKTNTVVAKQKIFVSKRVETNYANNQDGKAVMINICGDHVNGTTNGRSNWVYIPTESLEENKYYDLTLVIGNDGKYYISLGDLFVTGNIHTDTANYKYISYVEGQVAVGGTSNELVISPCEYRIYPERINIADIIPVISQTEKAVANRGSSSVADGVAYIDGEDVTGPSLKINPTSYTYANGNTGRYTKVSFEIVPSIDIRVASVTNYKGTTLPSVMFNALKQGETYFVDTVSDLLEKKIYVYINGVKLQELDYTAWDASASQINLGFSLYEAASTGTEYVRVNDIYQTLYTDKVTLSDIENNLNGSVRSGNVTITSDASNSGNTYQVSDNSSIKFEFADSLTNVTYVHASINLTSSDYNGKIYLATEANGVVDKIDLPLVIKNSKDNIIDVIYDINTNTAYYYYGKTDIGTIKGESLIDSLNVVFEGEGGNVTVSDVSFDYYIDCGTNLSVINTYNKEIDSADPVSISSGTNVFTGTSLSEGDINLKEIADKDGNKNLTNDVPYAIIAGKFDSVFALAVNNMEYGVLISNSTGGEELTADNCTMKAKGVRNSSGCYGVLFYGEKLKGGNTYYARPYVKYDDEYYYGSTQEFIMPAASEEI